MSNLASTLRFLVGQPAPYLRRPLVQVQPVLARRDGEKNVDLAALAEVTQGIAEIREPVAVESPEHWDSLVHGLDASVDAILPVSIAAYPTEIWNSHPQPLVNRGLPVVFWSILKYDEPDFWRWSARDFLAAVGADVHLVRNNTHGLALLRALGVQRMLRPSRLVVLGRQNFPWNAPAAGHLLTESLGVHLLVRSLEDMRSRYAQIDDARVDAIWESRRARYEAQGVRDEDLRQAVRTYLAIKQILEEEKALGFGVNCFGELVIKGGRDVPCLAQTLLREDGYIASCDGDYVAMAGMVLATFLLDKPCMMSNMYPVQYVGALTDHFGDPLSPDPARYPRAEWTNLARLGHCAFVGVVSPEMTPQGRVPLHDWGGTYEVHRDGRGCGNAGDLAAGEAVTIIELKFDGRTLLVARGEVCETTRHQGMPHCEKTALLRFRDLPGFVDDISREHTVIVYGDHVADFRVLGDVLGLDVHVY